MWITTLLTTLSEAPSRRSTSTHDRELAKRLYTLILDHIPPPSFLALPQSPASQPVSKPTNPQYTKPTRTGLKEKETPFVVLFLFLFLLGERKGGVKK